jgi:hypothetical protein
MAEANEWTPSEVPADHWSKSPEWLEYKRKQDELVAGTKPNDLYKFQQVGTITPGTRKLSTHDIQMASCKVEWIDPNPPEDLPASHVLLNGLGPLTEEQLAEMAKTILERVSKATDAQAG